MHEAHKMKKKGLKLATFIHLCNWSSNANAKSLIFFFKRNPRSKMSFSLPSSNRSSTSMKLIKDETFPLGPIKLSYPITKYDMTVFIRLVPGLVLGSESCGHFHGPSNLPVVHWIHPNSCLN